MSYPVLKHRVSTRFAGRDVATPCPTLLASRNLPPSGSTLSEDHAGLRLDDGDQVDVLNELGVLLALLLREGPTIRLRREFVDSGLRVEVKASARDPMGDFGSEAVGERPQHAVCYFQRTHAASVPQGGTETNP